MCYPGVEACLDAEGVGEILLLGPGRTPGSGVLKDIRELEPGCCAWYRQGELSVKRYWKLTDREHTQSFSETVEQVRELVLDAIRRQMVSDVPIGTFLSGGLDSSLISSVCSQELQARGEVLPAFSLDYQDNDRYFTPGKFQPTSDNTYIRQMIQVLPLEHHWTVLKPEDLLQAMEVATVARDLPGMADVDFSLLCLCADISQHVKVALSGECADEIFGGYPWYRDPQVRATDGFPWAQNTAARAAFLSPSIRMDAEDFVRSRYEQTIADSDILPENTLRERQIKQMVNLNYRWFMQTLLDRKDRMSMHNSLEVRVPFCDHRIAEYLYSVPWEYKDHGGIEKGLLRHAMEGILPKEVLWRKKSPYPKTHDPKYLTLVSQMLRQLLQRKDAPIFAMVNREALVSLLDSEPLWPWYGQLMRTPQTIAFMLQINFWLEHYHIKVL